MDALAAAPPPPDAPLAPTPFSLSTRGLVVMGVAFCCAAPLAMFGEAARLQPLRDEATATAVAEQQLGVAGA